MKEKKEPSLKTLIQIEMPIKRIESALVWLEETTKAKTLDEALGIVWSKIGPVHSRKYAEMAGMITTVLRAAREGNVSPPLNIEEWYATIAGL